MSDKPSSREKIQGTLWQTATEEELRAGLEKAFDYRGDVTITLRDGGQVEGYIFDRRSGATLADSFVRIIPNEPAGRARRKVVISYAEICGLEFSGRDTAAGVSWEAWVAKYLEKKAAGEKNIELKPEEID